MTQCMTLHPEYSGGQGSSVVRATLLTRHDMGRWGRLDLVFCDPSL